MTDHDSDLTGPTSSRDADRGRRIVAEFDSFAELLEGCAGRLSEEGVFLPTSSPAAVGSHVGFELRIREGFSVLRGEGEVMQSGPGVAEAGVAIRFDYLDQPSLRLLPKLIEHYRRREVPPFEVAAAPLPPPEPEGPAIEGPAGEDLPSPAAPTDAVAPELTLNDLEAEFLTRKPAEAPGPSLADEAERRRPGTGPLLVDAVELSTEAPAAEDWVDRPAPAPGPEVGAESIRLDEEVPLPDEGLPAAEQEALIVDEIPLDELFSDESLSPAAEPSAVPEASDEPVLDPGLPWLTEQPTRRRPPLWVVLLLVLLGAILGAVFYFFLLRDGRSVEGIPSGEAGESKGVEAMPEPPGSDAEPVAAALARPAKRPRPLTVVESTSAAGEAALADRAALPPSETPPASSRAIARPAALGSATAITESFTGIDRITWDKQGDETVVVLWADGSIQVEQIEDFRVAGGAPREVVKIRGVRRPCLEQQVEVASDHVRRIRTGLHETDEGGELHVVADLVDGEVELRRTVADGAQLRMYFAKTG